MVDDKYVDIAFNAAKKYITEKYPDTNSDFHARIKSDDRELRESVSKTMDYLLANINNSAQAETETRNITYLAGALGSKDRLKEFAKSSDGKAEFEELRGLMDKSIVLDFADLKKKFSEYSGAPAEPYSDIRPLISGIDLALKKITEEQNLNVVIDNNLKFLPENPKAHEVIKFDIAKAQESGILNVFAVALTPEQAKNAAQKSGMSVADGEAEKTALAFNKSFNEFLKDKVQNITLLDADGEVLLKKRDGKVLAIDEARLEKWQKSFESGKDIKSEVSSLITGGSHADHNNIVALSSLPSKNNSISLG